MARSSHGNKPGVMERIAVISVALSLAVMIVALAVIMGFKREVTRKMAGFAAHVVVTDIRGVNRLDSEPLVRSVEAEQRIRATEGFVSIAPYAVRGGIVRTNDAVQVTMLKGVDATYDWTAFGEWLVEGQLPRVADTLRTKDVLLSRNLADKLLLAVGDQVEMLFVEQNGDARRDRFKMVGIYSSGMDEMDDAVVMTDIRNVQRIAEWDEDEVTGYEIFTSDIASAGEFARRLNRQFLYEEIENAENLTASSVQELYPHVFDWLRAHDVNAVVIIVIMLIVAFFNMTSALLILVLERTRMIGLLKALGMPGAMLRRIFLYRGAFVALRGMLWGNAVGLGLCVIQQVTHVVELSSEGYLLSEVPVALEWGWWLVLNGGVLATIVLLLIVPSYIISTIKPAESIRYE